MGKAQQKPRVVRVEIELPESVCKFVEDWAQATGESKNDIAQCIFSYGLTSICAVNDWRKGLVDRVAPILEDLVTSSGENCEILQIDLATNAVYPYGNGKR